MIPPDHLPTLLRLIRQGRRYHQASESFASFCMLCLDDPQRCLDRFMFLYIHKHMLMIVWDEPKRQINLAKHELDFADLNEEFFLSSMVVPSKKVGTWQLADFLMARSRSSLPRWVARGSR